MSLCRRAVALFQLSKPKLWPLNDSSPPPHPGKHHLLSVSPRAGILFVSSTMIFLEEEDYMAHRRDSTNIKELIRLRVDGYRARRCRRGQG